MLKIVEESLNEDILHVKLIVEQRTIASRPLMMFKTSQVISLLQEKYKIIECIKEDIISNSKNGNHKQSGTWIFKVSQPVKETPTPKRATKKPSTKGSIRGRMSKIAKEKNKQ
tara:strand:+ start:898 stop:1236 length:339 start_codon:yes stop_codon:yes gene_type:complete